MLRPTGARPSSRPAGEARPGRRGVGRLAAWGAALLAAGCLSPTLPLPPPEEPDAVSLEADGTWTVRGSCLEGAEVIVLNEATGRGAVFEDRERRGRFVVSLDAAECDLASVVQIVEGEASPSSTFVVETREGGVVVDPSRCAP